MIAMNDFQAQWAEAGPAALSAVARVGASGRYILGPEVGRFEDELARSWGIPFAVGVGSGMDAIEIGLRCLGLKPSEKVLTTPLSAFATTLAIVRCGGVPVFVDTDETGLLDLELARAALAADRSIRFLVPVHLYGHALDLEALEALRDDFGLRVVEDCAQAIGARSAGRVVGSVGQVAAVSFYPTKNLGAYGDGGAILTSDPGLASAARALRHYGQTTTYVHDELGLNSRLDELHAAVLADALLPRLPAFTARRRELAETYRQRIRQGAVTLPPVPPRSEPVWHLFPVVVREGSREGFREFLDRNGVASGVHYPRVIPDQRALRDHGRFETRDGLERARRLAAREVSIPIHPFLSDEDAVRVSDAVSAWSGGC